MDPLQALIEFLNSLSQDPVAYSVVFFIYAVAASTFLPIPVEIGLFFSPGTPLLFKALVLGAGKATGSVLVFKLGGRVGGSFDRLASRHRFFGRFMDLMRMFVARTRYLGLYIILSIPLMVDTLPVYLFALFNQEGVMDIRRFALTNFLAGVTRALLVFGIAELFGVRLI